MSNEKSPTAGDFVHSLGDAIQANPIPAALIGMGAVWLLSAGRSAAMNGFAGMANFASASGSGSARGTAPTARRVAEQRSRDDEIAAGAQNEADGTLSALSFLPAARSNLADLLQRQPLMLGAIGLGVGAAMAATFKQTVIETDLFGQASAELREKARSAATAVTEQAATRADEVASAIANEARAQGLTASGLTDSAREAARKAKTVVQHTIEAGRSQSN